MLDCGGSDGIRALPARAWCAIKGSHLSDVVPSGTALDAIRGNSGPAAIISAWSGGALDTKRDRLLVWGGGHMDYAGNEVYAFNLHTLRWSRLSDPSLDVSGDEASGVYPDGAPRARHTYGYLQYVATFDSLCTFGGAVFYPSGQTGDGAIRCFDLSAGTWSQRGTLAHGGNIGAMSAVDPSTGRIWTHGTADTAWLNEYDPSNQRATKHVKDQSGFLGYGFSAAIDPEAQKFVAVGGGQVRVWDLTRPDKESATWTTSGGDTVVDANNPGLDYDARTKRLVAWFAGTDVYSLDLTTRAWTLETSSSTQPATPTAANTTGTFGRFRYVPALNVFVLVNGIDDDVFVYRLTP